MDWLIYFIPGWFGAHWWPGIEKDAPPPGPHPEPWWVRLLAGIVAGIVAIYVVRASGLSDPMPGMVLSIATGCVVGKLLTGAVGTMTKAR
jgi:hypothetical protein